MAGTNPKWFSPLFTMYKLSYISNTRNEICEGGSNMSVLENFDTWKEFLADKLEQAKEHGMSQQTIESVAYEVGSYLAQNVDAENKEEAALKDLWNAASKEEQQAIANAMVKLVQQSH